MLSSSELIFSSRKNLKRVCRMCPPHFSSGLGTGEQLNYTCTHTCTHIIRTHKKLKKFCIVFFFFYVDGAVDITVNLIFFQISFVIQRARVTLFCCTVYNWCFSCAIHVCLQKLVCFKHWIQSSCEIFFLTTWVDTHFAFLFSDCIDFRQYILIFNPQNDVAISPQSSSLFFL